MGSKSTAGIGGLNNKMTCFYNLLLKEYSDLPWFGFIFLFIVASLPFAIKKMRRMPILHLQGYNFLMNMIIPSVLFGVSNPPTGQGSIHIILAYFLAFGIGYSLLKCRKKEESNDNDSVYAIVSLIIFSGFTLLVILNNIGSFLGTVCRS